MSTELRNFLALSYDELEELNLQGEGAAQEPRCRRTRSRKSASST